jgi:hypothetical protein
LIPAGTPIEKTANFVSGSGRSYKVSTIKDDHEEEQRALPPGERDVAPSTSAIASDNFRGTARKAAKISIASAPMENFGDLKDMIDTLPAHHAMVNHSPKITTKANSNRVAEEKRNVRLKVHLYAASREDDGDYHLILGRAPGVTPPMYFTMELSGLPPASARSHAKLKAARTAFKNFFGNNLPGTSYDFYEPAIPVEIEGSLFFDMGHATGSRPGPAPLRPHMPVVWEVHPISKIVFEP